jgi:hypothetical protein
MAHILDGVSSLSFRLEGVEQVDPREYIWELLGFQKGAPNKCMCMKAHWKVFGVWSQEEPINKEILAGTPSSKCFTHGCAKGFLGKMRETKVIDTELSWLYLALIARQPIDPSHLMARGVTSPCWLSLWDRILQGTPSISSRDFPRIWVHEATHVRKWRWERRRQSGQSKFAPILMGKKIG